MVVTILTGRRPKLLKRTLDSLKLQCPEVLINTIIVMNNAYDQGTNELLKTYDFIDEIIVRKQTISIGDAMTVLAQAALKSGERLWLHIEDDWQCMNGGWFKQATILACRDDVSQVRLRLDSEKVLGKHMITGETINWRLSESGSFKIADNAHLTFNPSIIKTSAIPYIFPCTGERRAQKNYLKHMKKSVQLIPGVFKHIGDDQSLREITRCEV